jgi:hypothetical protein
MDTTKDSTFLHFLLCCYNFRRKSTINCIYILQFRIIWYLLEMFLIDLLDVHNGEHDQNTK